MRTINKIVITVIVAMLVLVFSGCEDDMDIEQVVRGVETPKEIVYTTNCFLLTVDFCVDPNSLKLFREIQCDNKVEVRISLDGDIKDFTYDEFKDLLGFGACPLGEVLGKIAYKITHIIHSLICIHDAPAPTFDDLLDAIEQVESGGDPNAVGDNGKAIGAYQIHKIYVDDVNRILELNGWTIKSRTLDFPEELKWVTHGDRWDRDKSREMTRIYLANYCNAAVLGRTSTYEDMARIHNGGPDGWKKDSTKKYWEKVKAVLYE